MAYYLTLFSPETYEAFTASDRTISGFRDRHKNAATGIKPGDRLLCYLTKLSRWIGVLEVQSPFFVDNSPIFHPDNDPFTIRFQVKPVIWLHKEQAIPIHEDIVWDKLSFTKDHDRTSSTWTGKFRTSLIRIPDSDALFLDDLLHQQLEAPKLYPIDEEKYSRLLPRSVRTTSGTVAVTVPTEEKNEAKPDSCTHPRQSIEIQRQLAKIGEQMGFQIWIPRSDRSAILQNWSPSPGTLLDVLPLNYDETTLKTVEQIDLLWLKGRSIRRAFEVEHTTAVYSGLLRMADLLALQPNMDINLHIVAPAERRDKVLQEIQRPVFSLLEKGPLSESCSYLSYDSVVELAANQKLSHMSDSILEDYEELSEQ